MTFFVDVTSTYLPVLSKCPADCMLIFETSYCMLNYTSALPSVGINLVTPKI